MVTHSTQYYDVDDPSFLQRYNGRGHGHPIVHQRDLPPRSSHGPYGGHRSSHDLRNNNSQSSEQDTTSANPRRRIPVACGRCRKRKIRCSGDPGNGGPCASCKSAGSETCQFLRVSSTEAQLKGDPSDFYDTPVAASRLRCHVQLPYAPTYTAPTPLGLDGYPAYRHNNMSAFPYSGVKYYSTSSFGDYPDENVDYSGLPSTSYPLMSSENLVIPSGSIYNTSASGSSRSWSPTAQLPKTSSLYIDQDSGYTQPQYQPATSSYSLRPTVYQEAKHSLSLSGMALSLPTSIAGSDRPVLPYPSVPRQPQVPLLPSSNELLSSSPLRYSTQSVPSSQQGEIYNPSPVDGSSVYSAMAISVDGNRSSEDLRYVPDSDHKRTPLNHSLSFRQTSGSISEQSPKLSNGRPYEPHYSPGNYYPTPPMATGSTSTIDIPLHRRSSGIQAT